MSGQRAGSYPSPNAAQVASGVPFFQQNSTTAAQDVPAMQELSAELSRALNSNIQQHDENDSAIQQQLGGAIPALELQQQLAQDAMGQLRGAVEYEDEEDEMSDGGTHHKRKKQKLSNDDRRQKNTRACDECRRKKVKCESEIGQELGIEACLACKKSGLQCQFSRVPQKRGPSKGYISKLDERLQNVENAIRDYVPQAAHRIGRPEATDLSAYDNAYMDGTPQAPGNTNEGPLDYVGNGESNSFWNHTPRVPPPPVPDTSMLNTQDLDESILAECYNAIQVTLPILSTDPLTQRRMLSQVPSACRAAFVNTIDCFVRSMGQGRTPVTALDLKTSSQFLLEADLEPQSTSKSLVLIQTFLLLSLTAERLGPAFAAGAGGLSSRSFVVRAWSIATELNIHLVPDAKELLAGTADSESKIARRLFVSLYTVDRWLAIGYGKPFCVVLPDNRLVLLAEDQQLLGQQSYQMARICTILTQIIKALPDIVASPASPSQLLGQTHRSKLVDLIQTLLDRVADDFAAFVASLPVLQAAFLHVELLVYRLHPVTDFSILSGKTSKLLDALEEAKASPLSHHFAALSGLSVAEVALHQQDNKAIASSVAKLDQVLSSQTPRDGSWEDAILNLVNAAATANGQQDAIMGLHNLADAAVTGPAVQALQQPAESFDMVKLVNHGYLTQLLPKT